MHPRCRCTISAVVGKVGRKVKGITNGAQLGTRKLNDSAVAKTFSKLQTYWSEKYNVKVADDLKYLNFNAVKTATQGVEAVLKEFPATSIYLKEFRVYADENIMSTSYGGQISFNPNYFGDIESLEGLAAKDAASGFHPQNTGILHYGAHEAGHILELALIKKYGGDIDDWINHTYVRRIVRAAYSAIKKSTGKNIYQLKKDISEYAAAPLKIGECLAEAVSDYISNKDNAATLSKEIWKVLKRELNIDDR